jgi:arginine N-succinyltransferase
MFIVRPARPDDLPELEAMARMTRLLLHSLPQQRDGLEARIVLSQDSFAAQLDSPGEEFYLFVLEDTASGRLRGTAAVFASAGYAEPFYAFRNDALIHASRELGVSRKIHVLTMSHELTGKTRLAGYYVDPALEGDPAAQLLARARMLFIAQHRRRFAEEVFMVLLGVTDDTGSSPTSPFWEAVGRRFFSRDFADIELASGGRSRTFIAEIMPVYPLYVPLLPQAAQRVLGEPHPRALLPYGIALGEGFEPDRFVDIFDAGPVLTARVAACRAVRDAVTGEARAGDAPSGLAHLVANAATKDFRCVLAPVRVLDGHALALSGEAADALGAGSGAMLRAVPLHAAQEVL